MEVNELVRTTSGDGSGEILNGDQIRDVMLGNGGDDTMNAFAGDDTLRGGAGADAMSGGVGNDIYYVDAVGDSVTEGGGAGTDQVQSTITHTLAANVENLTLTGAASIAGAGNSLANTINGNGAVNALYGAGGNDILSGGAGADYMSGATGNDTYVVDDVADTTAENSGNGTDVVQSTVTITLAASVEMLALNGVGAISGTGNGLANTMSGNSAANGLDGNGGNDTMTGYGGADLFIFDDGDGSDTVVDFQNGSDRFDLTAVAGIDDIGDLIIVDNGPTVTVNYGSGSFTIANLGNPAALDAADFLF